MPDPRQPRAYNNRVLGHDTVRSLDAALAAPVPEHVAAYMATHRDERHGARVAATRRRSRTRLPKPSKIPALSPEKRAQLYAENWDAFGRGEYPGPLVYVGEETPIERQVGNNVLVWYPLDVSDDGLLAVAKSASTAKASPGYSVVHRPSASAATPATRAGDRSVHYAGSTSDGHAFRTRAEAKRYMEALAAADILRDEEAPLNRPGARDELLDFNDAYFGTEAAA